MEDEAVVADTVRQAQLEGVTRRADRIRAGVLPRAAVVELDGDSGVAASGSRGHRALDLVLVDVQVEHGSIADEVRGAIREVGRIRGRDGVELVGERPVGELEQARRIRAVGEGRSAPARGQGDETRGVGGTGAVVGHGQRERRRSSGKGCHPAERHEGEHGGSGRGESGARGRENSGLEHVHR